MKQTIIALTAVLALAVFSCIDFNTLEHSNPNDPMSPNYKKTNNEYSIISITNTIGIVFNTIPGGTFFMASNTDNGNSDTPIRQVHVSNFSISIYETTYSQWTNVLAYANSHGYDLSGVGQCGLNPVAPVKDNPVTMVDWHDCVKWCNALSEMEGKTPCYYLNEAQSIVYRTGESNISSVMVKWNTNGYRLATEAEWEYACRTGSKNSFYWGIWNSLSQDDNVTNYAWYFYNSANGTQTHPVGLKRTNIFGLYDMSGNVLEWTWDWHGTYSAIDEINPKGAATGTYRVCRGGNFLFSLYTLRSGYRYTHEPYARDDSFGFRTVIGK